MPIKTDIRKKMHRYCFTQGYVAVDASIDLIQKAKTFDDGGNL